MKKLDAMEIKGKVIAAGFGLAAESEVNMLRRLEDLMLDGIVMGFELLAERVRRADACIAMLTADHNATPNYVKGFDMAQEYFADYPAAPPSKPARTDGGDGGEG